MRNTGIHKILPFSILIFFLMTCCLSSAGLSADLPSDAGKEHPHLSEKPYEDGIELCNAAWDDLSGLASPVEGTPESAAPPRSLPSVLISWSDGGKPFTVSPGYGKDPLDAVHDACGRAEKVGNLRYLLIDLIREVSERKPLEGASYIQLEPGLEGLILEGDPPAYVFTPSELIFSGTMDEKGRIPMAGLEELVRKKAGKVFLSPLNRNSTVRSFYSNAVFCDGEQVLPLYRGHRMISFPERGLLLESIAIGGRYLAGSVLPGGRFVYSYQADRDRNNRGYNILRHAGTIYAMLEVYEFTGDREILERAIQAFEHLEASFFKATIKGISVGMIVEDGYLKLGGNALALLAMTKYTSLTGDDRFRDEMELLARWMYLTQGEKGDFLVHKQSWPQGKVSDFESSYYPGEAIFSLVRFHGIDGNPLWLDVAEKAARYLILERDKGKPLSRLPHDHWLLYGLNELYRFRKDDLYLQHGFRIADAITGSQNMSPQFPDWMGSYYRPPRSTPTATRSEGLVAAYRLARDHGFPDRAEAYLQAVEQGIAFQLMTQVFPESAFYFPDPHQAMGGFRESLTASEIRIDYVQHNLSSIIGYLNETAE
ncbi:MAG: hypothetical protein JW971_05290 [Synergistales bacterium]|nr:hypothetical protein [Synergistales bacterium]